MGHRSSHTAVPETEGQWGLSSFTWSIQHAALQSPECPPLSAESIGLSPFSSLIWRGGPWTPKRLVEVIWGMCELGWEMKYIMIFQPLTKMCHFLQL